MEWGGGGEHGRGRGLTWLVDVVLAVFETRKPPGTNYPERVIGEKCVGYR